MRKSLLAVAMLCVAKLGYAAPIYTFPPSVPTGAMLAISTGALQAQDLVLEGYINSTGSALTSETSARQAADSAIYTALSSTASALTIESGIRAADDTTLTGWINSTGSALTDEINRATLAEAGKLSNTQGVPAGLIDLSTVTTALSGKLSSTDAIPGSLIDLSTYPILSSVLRAGDTMTGTLNGTNIVMSSGSFGVATAKDMLSVGNRMNLHSNTATGVLQMNNLYHDNVDYRCVAGGSASAMRQSGTGFEFLANSGCSADAVASPALMATFQRDTNAAVFTGSVTASGLGVTYGVTAGSATFAGGRAVVGTYAATALGAIGLNGSLGSLSGSPSASLSGMISGDPSASAELYLATPSTMYFYTAGTVRQTMLANGNVGIGTASPGSKLDISGGDVSVGTNYAYRSGGYRMIGHVNTSEVKIGSDNTEVSLFTDSTDRLHIKTGGNVGIGTTSPGATLTIGGSKYGAVSLNNDTNTIFNTEGGASHFGLAIAANDTTGMEIQSKDDRNNGAYKKLILQPLGGELTIGDSTVIKSLSTAANNIRFNSNGGATQQIFNQNGGKYNFMVGAQYNVDNAFEITPSTGVNGTSFTTPALTVTGAGNTSIAGTIKIAGGSPGSGKVLTSDASGNATWETNGGFASAYDSGSLTFSDSSNHAQNHGLGGVPKFFQVTLVCKTAEHGYSVGDETMFLARESGGGYHPTGWVNSTQIGAVYNNQGYILNKTTYASAGITTANWYIRLKAWR